MISKKDNLLVRPWQQRKFLYHKQKIQSALPAIDNQPPPFRAHVCVKLKKQQKEKDRCKRIEHDNYLLMQRLNYVMRTCRVDNTWRTPQPNFLNRVGMYQVFEPQIEELIALDFTEDEDNSKDKLRETKCYACTPAKNPINGPQIPEERVPWEPEKKPASRLRSKSVPVRRPQPLPSIQEMPISTSKPSSGKSAKRTKMLPSSKIEENADRKFVTVKEPHSIIFNRGCLKLSVNFPSDTTVKFQEANVEKFLLRGICHCKNSPSARTC